MSTGVDALREQLRRWVLLIGVAQVLFGCLVGFIPPTAVPWFRGIVMAHIEFTANGVLMTMIGLLAREIRLSAGAWRIWFWTLVIGTWTNGGAGLVGAFAGRSSPLMPTINQRFPPPGGPRGHRAAPRLRCDDHHRAPPDNRWTCPSAVRSAGVKGVIRRGC